MRGRMKSIFFILTILIFLSCSKNSEPENDTDILNLTDSLSQIDEIQDTDFPEKDEFDDDSDQVGITQIRFLSSPHGITRWNKQYDYFIRCESDKDSKTAVFISENDTCKGSIDSNTYKFTPTKEKFPQGKCEIVIECTDGAGKIEQKTKILIPNPVNLEISDEIITEFDVLWSDGNNAIVKDENDRLFGIDEAAETAYHLENIVKNTSFAITDSGIYYFATESKSEEIEVHFSNGKEDEVKEILDQNDFSIELSEAFNFRIIYSPPGISGIIIQIERDEATEIWHFDPETKLLSDITSLNIGGLLGFIPCVDNNCIVIGLNSEYLSFNEKDLTAQVICPNIKGFFWDKVWNNKIFQNNCMFNTDDEDVCLEYYDINTCERTVLDKNIDDIILTATYVGDNFYTIIYYKNSSVLTQHTLDGSQKETTFNGTIETVLKLKNGIFFTVGNDSLSDSYIASSNLWPPVKIEDCNASFKCKDKHLFCSNEIITDDIGEEKSCYRSYDLETGKETQSDLKCNKLDSFEIIGEFNDSVYAIKNGIKYSHYFLKLDYKGKYSTSNISLNLTKKTQPFFKKLTSTDNSDSMYFYSNNSVGIFSSIDSSRYQNIARLSPKYKPLSINIKENIILLKSNESLLSYNYKTEKSELIKTATFTDDIYFSGKLTLFCVRDEDIENAQIFYTTDETKSGTVEHGRKYWGFRAIPSEEGGFYIINRFEFYYLDPTGKNSSFLANGKVEYLGTTNSGIVFKHTDNILNKEKIIVFKNGEKISEYTIPYNKKEVSIFVEEDYIRMFANLDGILKVIHFTNGNLAQTPIKAELLNDYINNIFKIAESGNTTAYVLEIESDSEIIAIIKTVGNELVVTLELASRNTHSNYDDITGLISQDKLIYEKGGILFSFYESQYFGTIHKTLFDGKDFTDNESGYLGKIITLGSDFEGNAVFQYNHPDEKDKLIFSDGTTNSTIHTDISYWDQIDIINGKVVVKGSVYEVMSGEITKNDLFENKITSVKFTDSSHYIFTESDNGNIIFKDYFVPKSVQSQVPEPLLLEKDEVSDQPLP